MTPRQGGRLTVSMEVKDPDDFETRAWEFADKVTYVLLERGIHISEPAIVFEAIPAWSEHLWVKLTMDVEVPADWTKARTDELTEALNA